MKLNKIIEFFREEHQKRKTIEELSELIIAITRNDKTNITEEIADTGIMIDQICKIYDIKQIDIDNIRIQKLKRMDERIKA